MITEAFTGQTADVVSDEYDFMYREYHSTQGRWISPDPAGMSAVTLGNPQSWNRYAYVINNPLSLIDPSGLDFCIKALLDAAGNVMACFDEPGDLGHRGNFWGGWGPGDFGDGGSGVGFNGGFSGGPSGSWGEQPPVPLAPSPLIPANIMQILNFVLFNQPLDWNSVLWGTNCMPFCDVGPPANTATISAYHRSQGECLWQAAVDAGEDLLGISMIPGTNQDNWEWSSAKMGFIYTGAAEDGLLSLSNGVGAVETTAGWVEGTPAAQGTIRQFLRNQGVKWSTKHVAKDAALLGKVAGAVGKVLAAKSAYDRYQKCRGN